MFTYHGMKLCAAISFLNSINIVDIDPVTAQIIDLISHVVG